jgi:hypothetical protein
MEMIRLRNGLLLSISYCWRDCERVGNRQPGWPLNFRLAVVQASQSSDSR